MKDYLEKSQSSRGLVVEGIPDSLNKAFDGLDQHQKIDNQRSGHNLY